MLLVLRTRFHKYHVLNTFEVTINSSIYCVTLINVLLQSNRLFKQPPAYEQCILLVGVIVLNL